MMKKIIAFFLSVAVAVTVCVPAFAATKHKSETVTLQLDEIEKLLPGYSQYGDSYDAQQLSAQVLYLTYCTDILTTDSDIYDYNNKVQAQETAKKKYEMGYLSKKDYDDAVQATTDVLTSQQAHSTQRSQHLLTLRHMFGLDDVDKLIVKPADYSKINLEAKFSSINYKSDLKKLGWNDLYGSDATDAEITGNVEAFKKLYDSMRTVDQTYYKDKDAYQKKVSDAELTKQKVQMGYATQKELDDINKQVQSLANTLSKDQNSFYMAYLQYDYMRDHEESPV